MIADGHFDLLQELSGYLCVNILMQSLPRVGTVCMNVVMNEIAGTKILGRQICFPVALEHCDFNNLFHECIVLQPIESKEPFGIPRSCVFENIMTLKCMLHLFFNFTHRHHGFEDV